MIKEVEIGYNIDNLIKLCNIIIEELGIKSDVYIMPMKTSLDDNAYVIKTASFFIIYTSEKILLEQKINDKIIKVFIHELTHVYQSEKGDLVYGKDGKHIIWKGRVYTNKDRYDSRPFELEARNNEKKYLKKIKEAYKSLPKEPIINKI